jgi:hypothetical protein
VKAKRRMAVGWETHRPPWKANPLILASNPKQSGVVGHELRTSRTNRGCNIVPGYWKELPVVAVRDSL